MRNPPSHDDNSIKLKSFLREIALPSSGAKAPKLKTPDSFWKKVFPRQSSETSCSRSKGMQSWRIELAGWVNLPVNIRDVILLGFEYSDAKGSHRQIIDAMPARGAIQILLSGNAQIEVFGEHSDLELYCYGIEDRSVWVDDLHIDIQRILTKSINAA